MLGLNIFMAFCFIWFVFTVFIKVFFSCTIFKNCLYFQVTNAKKRNSSPLLPMLRPEIQFVNEFFSLKGLHFPEAESVRVVKIWQTESRTMRSPQGIGPCTGPWVVSFPKLLTTTASGNNSNNCNSYNNNNNSCSNSNFRSKSSPSSHLHLQTHRANEGVRRWRQLRRQTCPRPITGTHGPSPLHHTILLRRPQVVKRIFPVQVKKISKEIFHQSMKK